MTSQDKETRPRRPRIAFVAGGGGVKAYAFHLGVLRAMGEDGFWFRSGLKWEREEPPPGAREVDIYVGSSAGGCVVASLSSGHAVEELRGALMGTGKDVPLFGYRTLFVPVAPHPGKYLARLLRRWRFGGVRAHHLVDIKGLLTTRGVERYFRKHVLATNRFADLAPSLYLVATQVNNSRKVVFGPKDSYDPERHYDASCAYYDNIQISEALAASVSVPPVFAPYSIVNPTSGTQFHYYDGEVRDVLSAHVARDAGADFIVSSCIWNPYQYDKRVGTLADLGMSALTEQAIHQAFEQKIEQDQRRSDRYEQVLELIAERDAKHGITGDEAESFHDEVAQILCHRQARTLHTAPISGDHDFFFSGAFRFNKRFVDKCINAGYEAYQKSIKDDPQFLAAIDGASS